MIFKYLSRLKYLQLKLLFRGIWCLKRYHFRTCIVIHKIEKYIELDASWYNGYQHSIQYEFQFDENEYNSFLHLNFVFQWLPTVRQNRDVRWVQWKATVRHCRNVTEGKMIVYSSYCNVYLSYTARVTYPTWVWLRNKTRIVDNYKERQMSNEEVVEAMLTASAEREY